MFRRRKIFLHCLTALCLCVACLEAQMVPDAPVHNFKLPMFADNGYKSWDLQGRQGIYVNAERIDILGMKLRVFSGDSALRLETYIESPKATVLVCRKQGAGKSEVLIKGPNYTIIGRNWTWDGNTRTIKVREAVRVTFTGEIDYLLK